MLPPSTKTLSPINTYPQMKITTFSKEASLSVQTILQSSPMPKRRGTKHDELKGVFGEFGSHICFALAFFFFFKFHWFFSCVSWFLIWSVYGSRLCVSLYVCLSCTLSYFIFIFFVLVFKILLYLC